MVVSIFVNLLYIAGILTFVTWEICMFYSSCLNFKGEVSARKHLPELTKNICRIIQGEWNDRVCSQIYIPFSNWNNADFFPAGVTRPNR